MISGKVLHGEIVADIRSAKDKILRMQRERLYVDLGCQTFAEYVERHLDRIMSEVRWDRRQRGYVAFVLYEDGMTKRRIGQVVGMRSDSHLGEQLRREYEKRGRPVPPNNGHGGRPTHRSPDRKIADPTVMVKRLVGSAVSYLLTLPESGDLTDKQREHLTEVRDTVTRDVMRLLHYYLGENYVIGGKTGAEVIEMSSRR